MLRVSAPTFLQKISKKKKKRKKEKGKKKGKKLQASSYLDARNNLESEQLVIPVSLFDFQPSSNKFDCTTAEHRVCMSLCACINSQLNGSWPRQPRGYAFLLLLKHPLRTLKSSRVTVKGYARIRA